MMRMLFAVAAVLWVGPVWGQVWKLEDRKVSVLQAPFEVEACWGPAGNQSWQGESIGRDLMRAKFDFHGDTTEVSFTQGGATAYKAKTTYKLGRLPQHVSHLTFAGWSEVDGLNGALLIALWGHREKGPTTERVLTLFWQYPSGPMHSADLIASSDEERYGPASVELSETRVVYREKAFGICFETDQKKDKRYVTYWLDSGSFEFSKVPGKRGKVVTADAVEAVGVLGR